MATRRRSRAAPDGHLRVGGHLRVSTEDQSSGPDAQRAQIESRAVREAGPVVAWFEDHGVSAARDATERPGLSAALHALRERGAGVLVVAKGDRLARDVVIAGMVDQLVGRAGARVVSSGVGNSDSPADELLQSILDCAAAFERSQIPARTRIEFAVRKTHVERLGAFPGGGGWQSTAWTQSPTKANGRRRSERRRSV